MIPQTQTKFGEGGDCFAACIASILEYSIRDVPNFAVPYATNWLFQAQCWLAERGKGLASIRFPSREFLLRSIEANNFTSGHYIISGPSPRGPWLHSCVGCGGEIVHDPHPSRDGFDQSDWEKIEIEVVTVG